MLRAEAGQATGKSKMQTTPVGANVIRILPSMSRTKLHSNEAAAEVTGCQLHTTKSRVNQARALVADLLGFADGCVEQRLKPVSKPGE